jgi:HEPN domain-containing protein
MNGTPPKDEAVRRWLAYAAAALAAAEAVVDGGGVSRHACFHAQQAAEKAIKAVLVLLDIDFPWRHDLDALRLLVPAGWRVRADHPNLADLTVWAIEARYPGGWPEATPEDAAAAWHQARAVWESACADLDREGFARGGPP